MAETGNDGNAVKAFLGKNTNLVTFLFLALLLAAPALLVAMNQIYPDLPSGVLLACAIVEVAIVEAASGS